MSKDIKEFLEYLIITYKSSIINKYDMCYLKIDNIKRNDFKRLKFFIDLSKKTHETFFHTFTIDNKTYIITSQPYIWSIRTIIPFFLYSMDIECKFLCISPDEETKTEIRSYLIRNSKLCNSDGFYKCDMPFYFYKRYSDIFEDGFRKSSHVNNKFINVKNIYMNKDNSIGIIYKLV